MSDLWERAYSHRVGNLGGSVVREMLNLAVRSEVISFAGGLPSPELFPVHEIEQVTSQVLETEGAEALQYGPSDGHLPLRTWLAAHAAALGEGPTDPGTIMITSGSQQGIDLVAKAFIDPGDLVLLEDPSYIAAIQSFRFFGARFATVPLDGEGMQVDLIHAVLGGERPKFIYTIPNFHNPAGVTLSLERRRRLLEVARELDVPVVEDDPYGELRYSGERLPSLRSLDEDGRVIYLATFSKTLVPGFRLGWLVAPPAIYKTLTYAKQASDLNTNSFGQHIALHLCERIYDEHIESIRDLYRHRRDLMLAEVASSFPSTVHYHRPLGGLFLWMEGPPDMDAAALLPEAVAAGVAFVPGAPFFANGGGAFTFRLNFSFASDDQIRTGIARLGTLLRRHHGAGGTAP